MRNPISWLIACQSVARGRTGYVRTREKVGVESLRRHPPSRLGKRWSPKELRAYVRTCTHGVRQRATYGGTRVRTYVRT